MTMTTGHAVTADDPDLLSDEEARSLVVGALHAGAPDIVVQPILGLTVGRVVAYEALARFSFGEHYLPPDKWFGLAHRAGLGAMFEARAVDLALRAGRERPAGSVLSVNVSPSVLSSRELHDVLPFDLTGIQFEITEKEVVDDQDHLTVVLDALRGRGARVAVDDVGEGYAGLQRVMAIAPDLLKLDRSLVAGVSSEPAKAALVDAVVRYAAQTGAQVCAEGVENLEDLYTLADLDVAEAQGWVIGMPAATFEPVSEASQVTCASSFSRALASSSGRDPRGGPLTLQQLLSHLVDISDLDNLARAMAAVAETLACDRVELSYLDATGSYLEAVRPEAWQPEGVRYYLDEYLPTKRSLESQEIFQILVDDPDADAREVQWMQTEGLRTLIGVPIVCAGQAIGLLECCKVDSTPWSRSQLSRARMVTTVLGPVLGALQDRAR